IPGPLWVCQRLRKDNRLLFGRAGQASLIVFQRRSVKFPLPENLIQDTCENAGATVLIVTPVLLLAGAYHQGLQPYRSTPFSIIIASVVVRYCLKVVRHRLKFER